MTTLQQRYDELVLLRVVAASSVLASAVTALALVARDAVAIPLAIAYVVFLSPALALVLVSATEHATGAARRRSPADRAPDLVLVRSGL